jgi:hypothetical protein
MTETLLSPLWLQKQGVAVNAIDTTGALAASIEESRRTYTLGFYLADGERDAKFHEPLMEGAAKMVIVVRDAKTGHIGSLTVPLK